MADFILHRKISSVDPYPFPEYAIPIYGNGRFYDGFSIGDTSNLTVVNRDGMLKFSRGASNEYEETSVILGTITKNKKNSIYIDIASPLSQTMTSYFKIRNSRVYTVEQWTTSQIIHTKVSAQNQDIVRPGGVLSICFEYKTALPAIPNLLAVRALWLGSE